MERVDSNKKLRKLHGLPAWEPVPFVVESAKGLMTPERRAKNEHIALRNGGLTVLDNVGQLHADGLLTDAELWDLRDFGYVALSLGIPFSTPLEIVQGPARARLHAVSNAEYSSLGGRKLTTEQLAERLAEHEKEEAEDENKRKAERRGFEMFGKASYREWREDFGVSVNCR